jgi:surfactin family lipopeptide synthetase A
LLHETGYKIYLPVRAESHAEASKRVNNKFKYYFDTDLDCYEDRIVILVSDLEQPNLGVSLTQYQELAASIDSIIHSAALVKHYGSYDEAYRANVQSTINLLELSRLTSTKDFHYVSTIAVATEGYVPNRSYFIFDEADDASIFIDRNHTYATTKYEGEVAVNKYREYGVVANIYRVGYVGMHSTNYRHQENIGDNYLFVQFKTILQLGMIYRELSEVEIAPVDCTAAAIVKLFDQFNLSNQNYHIFNPHSCNLCELFAAENIPVQMYSFNEFVDNIVAMLNTRTGDNKQIELFMLHQKWLQEVDVLNVTNIKILQNKTEAILSKLGFNWPKITKEMWTDVVKRALIKDKLNA